MQLDPLLFGTDEREFITGRPEMDIILARAGDDEIFRFPSGPGAGGGDYTIDAGDGDDGREFFVAGDEGNDVILGGRGFDDLFGGSGNDVIIGEKGFDLIIGDTDDDFIFGSDGNDVIFGGLGKDTITGGPGNLMGRMERGDRYGEVVQRDKGLWIYSARHWRQGLVRPYLGRRKSGPSE
jgi:Ca2+-binding RTX toxin-like protein